MKKLAIAILTFLYFNTNIDAPGGRHFRMAERSSNIRKPVPKKGSDMLPKAGKGGSKQNNHLENYEL